MQGRSSPLSTTGHLCTTDMAGGYWYINNSVVAIHSLPHYSNTSHAIVSKSSSHKELSLLSKTRFAILDLDFHHGNGTQQHFYEHPSVLYVSIHGKDEYPYYTGSEEETGSGVGKGHNLNLPLDTYASTEKSLEKVEVALEQIKGHKPELLVVSLDFDTFQLDPFWN